MVAKEPILAKNFYMAQAFDDEINDRKLVVLAFSILTEMLKLDEAKITEIGVGIGKILAPHFAKMKRELAIMKFVPREVSELIKHFHQSTDKPTHPLSRS